MVKNAEDVEVCCSVLHAPTMLVRFSPTKREAVVVEKTPFSSIWILQRISITIFIAGPTTTRFVLIWLKTAVI
jgi:hypothetical protein